MNVKEEGNTFTCDCGFSWERGRSGQHDCGDGLRAKVDKLTAAMKETGVRAKACMDAFEGIETDRIAGKTLGEFLAGEVRLNKAEPKQDGSFGFTFSGFAIQMMAEAFAEQFKAAGAVNYLELLFQHDELGPLTVTMQRVEGLTPTQKLAAAEQRLQQQTIADGNEILGLERRLAAKDHRIAELEGIASDYAAKFQKAQDAVKYAHIMSRDDKARIAELSAPEPTEDMVIAGFECDAMQELCYATNKEKGWPYSCREAAELVTEIYKAMVEKRTTAKVEVE
ncbi:hypothetical protein [Serratia sp. JSRIV006]|uniref:hypothetical protein n=1 Tax=Serratia sp. JSRIV006 TaxID=2831896 RepID=UPI001CC18751|nr:hypothetical protein [Serratia sp. JSRIV006]